MASAGGTHASDFTQPTSLHDAVQSEKLRYEMPSGPPARRRKLESTRAGRTADGLSQEWAEGEGGLWTVADPWWKALRKRLTPRESL